MLNQHLRLSRLWTLFAFVLGLTVSLDLFAASAANTAKTESVEKKTQNIAITADSSVRDSERQTAELDGHVQIVYGNQHLAADHAFVNLRAKTLDARGNVLVTSPNAIIGGQRIVLDLESNTGIIYSGYVQSAAVNLEGRILYKTSDIEFIAEDAHYTTCTTCPEAWSFAGTKIRAQLGGYAYIKNSIFEFGGWPIVWLPYLIVPLKSDRQSGFLTPEFENSSVGGFGVGESYFWAMSRNQDSTYSLKDYGNRGIKSLFEYRYSLDEHSGGTLNASYLEDQAFAHDPRFVNFLPNGYYPQSVQRWFFNYQHYQELPDGFVHRMQVNTANDLQYPKDFPMETMSNGDPAFEHRMSISQSTDDLFWMADSSYYTNLLQSDPQSGNNQAVHRLPELRLTRPVNKLGKSEFLYSYSLDYTNFTRQGYGFDTLNSPYSLNQSRYLLATSSQGDPTCTTSYWETDKNCFAVHNATFNSGTDLIRTGSRFDGNVEVHRPYQISKFVLIPKLTYRESDYQFTETNVNPATRQYLFAELDANTQYTRIYDISGSRNRIKHEIQPDITYSNIFWINQPANPFFGTITQAAPYTVQNNITDSDLNSPYGLQFDYYDRTYNRKIVTYSVTNRFIKKSWDSPKPASPTSSKVEIPQAPSLEDKPSYGQFAYWKLAQSYDIYQGEGNSPNQPWSDISSDMSVSLDPFVFSQRYDFFPYQSLNNSSTKIRLLNEKKDFVQVGYDLQYSIVPGQPVNPVSRTEQYSFMAKRTVRFVDLLGKIIYDANPPRSNGGQQWINSYAVAAQFRLPGDCMFFQIMYYRPTGGTENYTFNFDFSWDGKPKPSLSEGVLDQLTF